MQQKFSVLRLNSHSDSSWAVIEAPSGRIVADASGNLLMRLTKAEALALANSLTDALPPPPATLAEPANTLPI